MKIAMGAADEHARAPPGARAREHELLGARRVLRLERERGLELGGAVGLAAVLREELGEQRVRLDARVVEGDGAPQVRLRRRELAAVELGEREAHAHVVAVEGRAERRGRP